MQKHIVLLSIIFLAFQAAATQQLECEGSLRSFRIQKALRNLREIYSLRTLIPDYKRNGVAPMMPLSAGAEHLQSPEKRPVPSTSLAELTRVMTSIDLSPASSIDPNDIETIRKQLQWAQGNRGAVAIPIDPLNGRIAENTRRAINKLSSQELDSGAVKGRLIRGEGLGFFTEIRGENMQRLPTLQYRDYFSDIFTDDIWHEWWEHWIYQLTATGRVSFDEMRQLKIYMDQLIQEIKDIILKTDGKNIEVYALNLRTEKVGGIVIGKSGHSHYFSRLWLTVSTSALGPGTWFFTRGNGRNSVTLPGQALLLSEGGRNTRLENKDIKDFLDYPSASHGTPDLLGERLIIFLSFKLASEENQSL